MEDKLKKEVQCILVVVLIGFFFCVLFLDRFRNNSQLVLGKSICDFEIIEIIFFLG